MITEIIIAIFLGIIILALCFVVFSLCNVYDQLDQIKIEIKENDKDLNKKKIKEINKILK